MSVLKYKDPTTGEVKKLFAPVNEGYTKEETYNKQEVYNKTETYNKEETNTLLQNKADLVEGKVPTSQIPPHSHDGADITTGLDVLATAMGASRIVVGSYVGTGTKGSSNPNSLTFSSPPKVVFIAPVVSNSTSDTTRFGLILYPFGAITSYRSYLGSWGGEVSSMYTHVKVVDNTVYWYDTYGPYEYYQCNISGVTYNYLAIL